jgi:hypothetical protein
MCADLIEFNFIEFQLYVHTRQGLKARGKDQSIRNTRSGKKEGYKRAINIFERDKQRESRATGYKSIASYSTDSKT